jgi:hypothetical protein
MAYVADFTTKSNAAKALTLVFAAADFPPHVADDYLVIGITCEAEVAVAFTATAGWTQIGITVGNPATATGLYSSLWYKKCASAAEACTITLSVTNASHGHAFLIKDADLTTFLDGTPAAATFATASQFSSASITTTSADTLLLHYIGIDSTTTTPTMCHSAPGPVHFLDSSDNGGTNVTAGSKTMAGACAGWYMQRTPGATPTPGWNMSLTGIRNEFVVGIKHKAGGLVPPYIDDSVSIGTKVMDGHWWASATTRNNENFKATPLSVTSFITHLGTFTGTFDALAAVADSHINPYSNAVSSTPATSAAALTGFELQIPTTPIDMSAGWLVGSVMESTPKAANWGTGSIKTGGVFVAVGSTLNYRIFQVLARDNLINTEGRAVFSVQVNQTQTQSGQSTAAPTVSAINRVWVLNRGNLATLAQYHCDYHVINKIIAAGGDVNNPVDSEGLYQIGKFLRLKLIQKQGAGALMPLVPIQIGGGDAIQFEIDAGALQFPRIYNRTKREINYHGADNAIGISYAGKAGDVIKHTNSVVTSASPYYWEINAAATSAATWDFSGLVVVMATVTLRPVMTFNKMSFSDCPTITLNSSTVTSCSFNNSKLVAASPADAALVSGSTFASAGTGHAIEIGGIAANVTLSGLVFTGYAASNGSTGNEAIFVNIASGTMDINIGGGGSTPSIRTAGATVNVVSGATVTFTGIPAESDMVVLSGTTILKQIDGQPVFGVNLISNGDFSTATDMWSANTWGGTSAIVNGELVGTSDASPWTGMGTDILGTTVGSTYRVSFKVRVSDSLAWMDAGIDGIASVDSTAHSQSLSNELKTFDFVATATSHYLVMTLNSPVNGAGTQMFLDDVSIVAVSGGAKSSSYSFEYSGAQVVDVGFIKPGYVPFYIRNLSLTAVDSSIPVSLTVDRNYS